tara:strand:+ start:243 stop:359 length:117 start_codon:yes stop_codon:yes gene_type:complete
MENKIKKLLNEVKRRYKNIYLDFTKIDKLNKRGIKVCP